MVEYTDKVREGITDGKDYLIISGSLVDGFIFIGPFTWNEASGWCEERGFHHLDTVHRIFSPDEIKES